MTGFSSRLHQVAWLAAVVTGTTALAFVWAKPYRHAVFPAIRQIMAPRGSIEVARYRESARRVIYSGRFADAQPGVFQTDVRRADHQQVGPSDASLFGASETAVALGLRPVRSGRESTATLAMLRPGASPEELIDHIVDADFVASGIAAIEWRESRWRLHFPIGKVLFESATAIKVLRASPNGQRVALLQPREIRIVDATGTSQVLTVHAEGAAWSGDGQLWFSSQAGTGQTAIWSVIPGASPIERWRAPGSFVLQDGARDGRLLLSRNDIQYGTLVVSQNASHGDEQVWIDRAEAVAIASAGQAILINTAQGLQVRRMDGAATVPPRLGTGRALTEDGTAALSVRDPHRFDVLDLSSGISRELSHRAIESSMAWFHPDGRRILLNGRKQGAASQDFLVPLDGSESPTAVGPEHFEHEPDQMPISNDGRWVLGFASPERSARVYRLDENQSNAVNGLAANETAARFADGDRELFVFNTDGLPTRIFRLDYRTGQRRLWREVHLVEPTGVAGALTAVMTSDGRVAAFNYKRVVSALYEVTGLKEP